MNVRLALAFLLLASPSTAREDQPPTVFDILGSDRPSRSGKAAIVIWGRGGESAAKGFREAVADFDIRWIPIDGNARKRFARVFPRAEITEVVDPWGRVPSGKGQAAVIRALRKQLQDLHAGSGVELLILGKVEKRMRVVVADTGEEVQKDPVTEVEIVALAMPSGERLFTRSHRLQWPSSRGYDPAGDLAEIGRGFGRRFRHRLAAHFDKKSAADGTEEGR